MCRTFADDAHVVFRNCKHRHTSRQFFGCQSIGKFIRRHNILKAVGFVFDDIAPARYHNAIYNNSFRRKTDAAQIVVVRQLKKCFVADERNFHDHFAARIWNRKMSAFVADAARNQRRIARRKQRNIGVRYRQVVFVND